MDQQPTTCEHAGPGRPRLFDEATALEAALRVFWDKGYRMTTLEDLTAAMGLSRSSLYGCYGSKHDIYLAAFRSYNETSLKALTALVEEAPTPREAVRRVFAAMADTGGDRRGCFFANCVTEMAPHDPEVKDLSRRQHDRIEDLLADAYRHNSTPADAADKARAVMSVAIGAVQMRKAGVEPARLEALVTQIEPLLPISES
jgi:TetR/AcrR family transcriptional regulator, transcriptional repressor for nem operon